MGLVAGVDADQQRGQRLGDARHLEPAAVDAAQARDALDQLGGLRACRPSVAAHEHVLVERLRRGRERGGARPCAARTTTRTPSGHHLGRLLRGRALPDAEHPRRPAATRRRRAARSRRPASWPSRRCSLRFVQGLGLVAERHAQEHDARCARRPRRWRRPSKPRVRHALAQPRGGLLGARSASREPITTGDAGLPEAQREAEAERARAADDRDRCGLAARTAARLVGSRRHAAGGTDRARHRRRLGHRGRHRAAAGGRGRARGGRRPRRGRRARVSRRDRRRRRRDGRRRHRLGRAPAWPRPWRRSAPSTCSSTTPAPTASRSS